MTGGVLKLHPSFFCLNVTRLRGRVLKTWFKFLLINKLVFR